MCASAEKTRAGHFEQGMHGFFYLGPAQQEKTGVGCSRTGQTFSSTAATKHLPGCPGPFCGKRWLSALLPGPLSPPGSVKPGRLKTINFSPPSAHTGPCIPAVDSIQNSKKTGTNVSQQTQAQPYPSDFTICCRAAPILRDFCLTGSSQTHTYNSFYFFIQIHRSCPCAAPFS